MEFSDYQHLAIGFAKYPNQGNNVPYTVLGLCGETGEVAEKIKKVIRDKNSQFHEFETREALIKEMGDVLWYLSALAVELNINLNYVAEINLEKLESRKQRGVLQGSGDNR